MESNTAERIWEEEAPGSGDGNMPPPSPPAIDAAPPPEPPPMIRLQKMDFNSMPNVSLLVPEHTSPAELIRITATICEEVGLMVLRRVVDSAMGL